MTIDILQQQTQLIVRQRIRLMVNQYEVHGVTPDGQEAGVLAFAQQKRLAFKEQVTLYADDTKQVPVLGFKARQVIDLGATYDVFDAAGNPLGLFRKKFGASLLRSTWVVEQPGWPEIVGQERNLFVALCRRFIDYLSWLPYHFDFEVDGRVAFSVERKWGLRDTYNVTINEPNLDRRLVVAMAVGLDALQSR
ncbi:hypothetical protein Acy02nite_52410 [Actinoplanes cyaneus]|uniref:Uncharacterized protein n=2 Tax=Actinoplanes cyaneus TaxID=52696 RepID=A0A919ISQ4_9ACTN|nr:Uncharacterized protein YxjI [Actinoplanes cyaneus]GID67360.1 hypothetical protein Acy02nite_52410 [Actinoplanes cyaneus]